MKNVFSIIKIKVKKNKLWLILLSLVVLLSQSVTGDSLTNIRISNVVSIFAQKDLIENNEIGNNEDYWYQSYEIEDSYREKYKELIPQADFNSYISVMDSLTEEYIGDQDPESIDWENDFDSTLANYKTYLSEGIYLDGDDYKLNVTKDIFKVEPWTLIFIFILSVLLTSGEHMTKYYEFVRMLPWSNTNIYLSTQLLGILIVIPIYFLGALIKYMSFSSSALTEIMTVTNIVSEGLIFIPVIIGLSIMLIAIGVVSGNFIGHLGMSIIGFGGLGLFMLIALGISYVFIDVQSDYFLYKFGTYIEGLSPYIRTILSPIEIFSSFYNVDESMLSGVLGLSTISLIYGVLGLYWSNTAQAQRSGQLVLKSGLSNAVQVIATIATGTLIFAIFGFATDIRILGITIWLLGIVISYLFYNKLFNVSIGI